MQDTKTPVKVAVVSLVVYTVAALLLYKPLATFGLGLAVACSSVANFLTLLWLLRRRLGPLGLRHVLSSVIRSAAAAAGCAGAAWYMASFGQWNLGGSSPRNYTVLLGAVAAGSVVYFVLCKIMRVPELDALVGAFRRKRG